MAKPSVDLYFYFLSSSALFFPTSSQYADFSYLFLTGCLKNLKVLNVSFNHLKSVPPEIGDCENLEKLDLSGNMEITELPFEVR